MTLAYLAIDRGGYWILLIWPALSLLVISAGYMGLGAFVYGKRKDGSFSLWSLIIHFPYFIYSWSIWYVLKMMIKEAATDTITNNLTIGRRLTANEISDEFDYYVDLTSEFIDPQKVRQKEAYRCFPILDADVPPKHRISSFLNELNGNIYIHCAQGHGRTGLFAILLLANKGEIQSFDEGYSLLKSRRPLLGVNKKQRLYAIDLIQEMGNKGFEMILRKETPADIESITEVTIAAFQDHPISKQTEQFIIKALRSADAMTLSIVAEMDGRVVGHIAFSPVRISDGTKDWYGLGPISVLPELQKQGIGKSLVIEGLSRLKELGGEGCMLVGDTNYYKRFDFKNYPQLIYEGIPQEFFLALPFNEKLPQGNVVFHEAFSVTS